MYTSFRSAENSQEVELDIKDREINIFVSRIIDYAKDFVRQNVTNYKAVTAEQIALCESVLADLYDSCSFTEANCALKKLFTIIPRQMYDVDAFLLKKTFNFESDKLRAYEKEKDLIDALKVVLANENKAVANKSKKISLASYGISIEKVSENDMALIKRKLGENADKLVNAYKFTSSKAEKGITAFKKEKGLTKRDSKLLWHGTINPNLWGIMTEGLKIQPHASNGRMFGNGLYFAPSSTKSLGYSSKKSSYWAKGNSETGFLILNEVAVGKPLTISKSSERVTPRNYANFKNLFPDFESVYAKGGSGMLRNDEVIVYSEAQVQPLYIVEVRA